MPLAPNAKPIVYLVILITVLVGIYQVFKGSDEFSPEEINSLLQNKDQSIVRIRKVELTKQKIEPPYLEESSLKVKNWDVKGNAMVKNNDYIRLTSDNQHQVGNMFGKQSIQAQSFEMELTFHIHSKSHMVGDGFAIWLLDEKSDIGDVFGATNYFNGLGIMIDTYKNGKRGHFPYVNLMLGDGHTKYRKSSDGFETRLAGCTAHQVLNPPGGVTKARIVYIKDGYFSLDFNFNNEHEKWTNCVTLSDVKLPMIKHLGFTAETGDLSEAVDIMENRVYALYKPDGDFIQSVDELETLIKQQDGELPIGEDDPFAKPKEQPKKNSKRTRKSIMRLRKAEQRIKERQRQANLENYGDPDSNIFKRFFKVCLTILKYIIYLLVIILVVWVTFILIRIRKQKQTRTTGLLD